MYWVFSAEYLAKRSPRVGAPNNRVLRWARSPIANRQCSANVVNSRRPFRNSAWNECYTNERHSRDTNRGTTNAGSMRTSFCVLEGDMTANER